MRVHPFQTLKLATALAPAPINPAWITGGNPVARNAVVARSSDTSAYTMVWDCTAGSFTWTYDCDETVLILEGSIVLTDEATHGRRLGPGDSVFFPKGAKVDWVVDEYVRKFAVMHNIMPVPVAAGMKLWRRVSAIGNRAGAQLRGRLSSVSPRRSGDLAGASDGWR